MYIGFNLEELEFLRYFEPQKGRLHVLRQLRQSLPYADDTLTADSTELLIRTVDAMTDEQFEQAVVPIL